MGVSLGEHCSSDSYILFWKMERPVKVRKRTISKNLQEGDCFCFSVTSMVLRYGGREEVRIGEFTFGLYFDYHTVSYELA